MISRRHFLGGLLAFSSLPGLGATRPAGTGRRLVLIHLLGGNDGLNTVVPSTDPRYRKARAGLALPTGELLALGSGLGLHPSLAPLHELWQRRQLAIVQGVGYPSPNRSHFLSSDIWHSGATRVGGSDGWLGRLAALRGWDTLQVDQQSLCRALWGGEALCVDPGQEARLDWPPQLLRPLAGLYARAEHPHLRKTYADMQSLARRPCVGERWKGAPLRQALGTMLELWPRGRIFHTSLGGFDTHGGQPERHARALGELATALADFYAELQRRDWHKETLVLVYSEFGRRVEVNASLGTDHGGAGPVLLLGGAVKGGFYGEHPELGNLLDGDLRHGVDFRQVYASVLSGWFETDSRSILGGSFDTIPCWA